MQKIKHSYTGSILRVCSLFYISTIALASSVAAQGKTETITHKGNVFEIVSMADTATILDPITTEIKTVISNPNPIPVKLNNMNIYAAGDVDTKPSVTSAILIRYIVQSLNKQISALGNGEYRLRMSNVIISDFGKIVYYNFEGLEKMQSKKVTNSTGEDNIYATTHGATNDTRQYLVSWKPLSNSTNKDLTVKLDNLMNKAPAYKAAKVQNNPVPYRLPDKEFEQSFTIKNGAIYYN